MSNAEVGGHYEANCDDLAHACGPCQRQLLLGHEQHKATNSENCLDGASCDQSLLTSTQARPFADVQRDKNLWSCTSGYAGCNGALLTPAEANEGRDDRICWPVRQLSRLATRVC